MQIHFQDPFSALNPRMSIGQIIEEGLVVNKIGDSRGERHQRVADALVSAGMLGNILSAAGSGISG